MQGQDLVTVKNIARHPGTPVGYCVKQARVQSPLQEMDVSLLEALSVLELKALCVFKCQKVFSSKADIVARLMSIPCCQENVKAWREQQVAMA